MSIAFISSTDYQSGQITEFSWNATAGSNNDEIELIKNSLVLQYEGNFGKILRRSDNGDLWFKNPEDKIARLITETQFELFKTWEKEDLLPNDEHFQKLRGIGGLASPKFTFEPRYLQFPAKITMVSGRQIDLCIFHFSEVPPFQRYFQNVVLLSEVVEIGPSEFSLPYDLRLDSTLADEVKMSFYPFMVQTKSGEIITFNGVTQFASNGKIIGNEIIGQIEFSWDKFTKEHGVADEDVTYVIGKWDNRLENLFVEYRNQQQKRLPIITPSIKRQSFWDKFTGRSR